MRLIDSAVGTEILPQNLGKQETGMITKTIGRISLAALIFAALVCATVAQDSLIQHRIDVSQSIVIAPDQEATRFAVGDEQIAAVEILSPVEFLVVGKRVGRTNVIIWFLDGGREERLIIVEEDLEPLRRRLSEIDPEIRVEGPASDEVILSGSVETYEILKTVLRLASDYLSSAEFPDDESVSISSADEQGMAEGGESGQNTQRTLQFNDSKTNLRKVRNLLTIRSVPQATLLERLQAEAAKYSDDISVRRIMQKAHPDDLVDTFVVEGSIASQGAYTQLLSILDRILGGKGLKFRSVTDSSGAFEAEIQVSNEETGSGSSGGVGALSGSSNSSSLTNNIEANPGRSTIVLSENERLMSFVKVTEFPQVIVAVRILELNRSKIREAGVDWALAIGDNKDFRGPLSFPSGILPAVIGASAIDETIIPDDRNVSTVTDGLFVNSLTIVEDQFVLNNTIHLLEGKGYLRTLSEPNLVTLSGEIATFLVGGQFPVRQVGSTNETVIENVNFLEYGIRLSVRPVVAEDGMITLDVSPAISSVVDVTEGGNPILDVTSLNTSVKLKDGEGIILGGLIMSDEREQENQVPWLGDIPYLGRLFQRKTRSGGERELALILMPKIANPQPRENFALEPPPLDYEIRPGTYIEPELGKMPELPKFINTNVGTGERITINVDELPEFEPTTEDSIQPEIIEVPVGEEISSADRSGPAEGDVILVVPSGESNP